MLIAAGHEVVFASPKGGEAPIDLLSMKTPFTTEHTEQFLNDPIAMYAAQRTRQLRNIDGDLFDAIFVPGGYGLLWDLASDQHLIKLIKEFYETDRPIAMVCHAPAILRDVKFSNDKFLVEGVKLTGFKDEEDTEIELDTLLLFSLEQELKRRGANYYSVNNWEPNIVEDGALMTGLNPASAPLLAEALANRLK
jgi:putative intracellular protease/amidase